MNKIHFSAMSREELMSFWGQYNRAGRKTAQELLGAKFTGYTLVASDVANLASNMAAERMCQERGDSDGASVYAHAQRLIRGRLPAFVVEALV